MASPFDFSSFLLTPPIPNYSNTTTNNNSTSAIANTNSNNGNSGNSANSGSGSGSSSNNDQYRNDNQGVYQLADSNASASSYQPMNPSNLSASAPAGSGFPTPAQYGNTNAGKQTVNYASHANHGYGYSQQPQQQNSNQYGQPASAHRQPQQQQQQYEQQYAQPNHQQSQQQNQSQPYYSGEQSASYGAIDPSGYPSYGDSVNHQQQSQQQQQLSYHSSSLSSNLPPVASGSSSNAQHSMNAGKMPSLDERDYGLDPSAFSSVSFQMPSFLAASSQPGEYGVGSDGPSVVDPSAFHQPAVQNAGPYPSFLTAPPAQQPPQQQQQIYSAPPNAFVQPQQPQYMSNNNHQQQQRQSGKGTSSAFTLSAIASAKKPSNKYVPDPKNPVYGIYGSSVISVNPDTTPFKLALNAAAAIPNPIAPEDSRSGTPDFDPKSLGLPVGEQLFPQPLPGLYSSSGFDMLGVLARVAARPNPQINIGPVDTSCSFLVVDARRYDMPIVFASDTFSKLTGYSNAEIIGRNCRFLQAPDGSVPAGSRRKYTDGNAVYHLKTHIQSGKETQASIINYRKDGSPFINLVTVIPIAWDTDEIAYFVGFQVDLVEQPNAILEKMRNGTYVVNYSLLPTNATAMPTTAAPPAAYPTEPQEEPIDELAYIEPRPIRMADPTASGAATAAAAHSSMTIAPELLEVMGAVGNGDELDDDAAKKKWNKMLLDHTGDFVHVLSLKGSFLYVSPSVKTMLEYDPPDLVGKTLQSVCHPSDIVPVMRELKDSSNNSQPVINLLYRFRRKNSGYIWLEAQGKLYLEQSKSRKCVILVGRERPVYKLSWNDLRAAGGLGEKEYWSKVTSNGMFLYNTPTVKTVLGHEASTLQGKSLFDLVETSKAPDLALALNDARAGKSVRLRYRLKSAKGKYIDVITNFYPNSSPVSPERKRTPGVVHPSIVLQTNEYSSEVKRRATMPHLTGALPPPTGILSPGGTDLANGRPNLLRASSAFRDMVVTTPEPSDDGNTSGSGSASGSGSGSDSSAPSTFSAIPSTYKTLLSQASAQSDNLFDELDTTRTTSWQYELHQLKLTNKKLKEELSMLQAARRKRKKKEEMGKQGSSTSAASPQPPAQQQLGLKTCANCGRTDSPEWRVGPTGIRNLCNACGLRWAKATRTHRQSSSTPSGSTSSSANSDMENAASGYMQPGGPFAIQRPPFQHAESSRFNQSGH